VIADHLRAMTFLIAEGVMPSNEGRGYVLRRIMRRAARHGKMLGLEKPFLYRLTGNVADLMGGAYPELRDARDYVARLVLVEEERFIGTLEYGLKFLNDLVSRAKEKGDTTLPGDELFKLYDTYGFPMDLVQDVAVEQGLVLDFAGYEKAMEAQKAKAKAAQASFGEDKVKEIYRKALESAGPTKFVGYDATEADAKIVAIIKGNEMAGSASEGEEAEVILATTPFYAESGGQVGDRGALASGASRFDVADATRPLPGLFVHKGRVERGTIKTGDTLHASVDTTLRKATARNHTATHLLQAVLRYLLGDHVKQAGSLVEPGRLRFDFAHFAPLTQHEKDRVEELMNGKVLEGAGVTVEEMDTEKAIGSGATALFGEKYGDKVRVVRMGDFSSELCGGTHLGNTADVGLFKLLSESGVAAGVRRIEAVTGEGAYVVVQEQEKQLREVAGIIKSADLNVADKVGKLNDRMKELEKELEKLKGKMSQAGAGDLLSNAADIAGVKLLAQVMDGLDAKDLRSLGDNLKEKMDSGIIVLGSSKDGRVSLLCMVTKDLVDRYKAGDIIKEVAAVTGGSGGGRPDMAQAGGKDASKLPEAIGKAREYVERVQKG